MRELEPSDKDYIRVANCLPQLIKLIFAETDPQENIHMVIKELWETVSLDDDPSGEFASYDMEIVHIDEKDNDINKQPSAYSFCFNNEELAIAENLKKQA